MTYTIDISKDNIRQYTSEELRDLADKGLLYAGDFCLSEFVNKILVGTYSAEDMDNNWQSGYDDGKKEGYSEGYDACLDEA